MLATIPDDGVPAFLTAHSGLPGPRANLELLAAFADHASAGLALRLTGEEDEYLRCAGVVAQDATAPAGSALLRERATDDSWRVREAVAMALQRIEDPVALRAIVAEWATSTDPLVLRAAIAGICEPALLTDPATAALAVDACQSASTWLSAQPPDRRREPTTRVLRKGLGYCWSVAVAAAPEAGLPRFAAFEERARGDVDLEWVARTNRSKARLARLLD